MCIFDLHKVKPGVHGSGSPVSLVFRPPEVLCKPTENWRKKTYVGPPLGHGAMGNLPGLP